MRNFFLALVAFLFTVPAFAAPSHWTCINDNGSILFFVINNADFIIFDKDGKYVGTSKFEEVTSSQGVSFMFAVVDGVGIGARRTGESSMVLALSTENSEPVKYGCH